MNLFNVLHILGVYRIVFFMFTMDQHFHPNRIQIEFGLSGYGSCNNRIVIIRVVVVDGVAVRSSVLGVTVAISVYYLSSFLGSSSSRIVNVKNIL